jgi:3-oxosteroid 1-dehydrogenase
MAWDESCDVLVVGSGAGGLTAATVAANLQAKTVVIEKSDQFGGTSATSGGVLWIPASHLAAAAGQAGSQADALTYVREVGGADAPEPLYRAYVENADRMLAYMHGNSEVRYSAIPYPDYQPHKPGGRMGYRNHDCTPLDGRLLGQDLPHLRQPHPSNMLFGRYPWNTADAAKMVTRRPGWIGAMWRTLWRYHSDVGQRLRSGQSRYLTGGNALIARLKLSLDRRGVEIRRNTKLVELVRENGRVAGAVIENGGVRRKIEAKKAVVLASGGFARSETLRGKYLTGSTNTEWSAAQPNDTGDGLVAGLQLGAATRLMDSAWRAPAVHVPGEDRARALFIERALPGSIIVNQAGERYMNEAVDYHLAAQAMIDNDRPGAGTSPSFVLFDARFKWRYPMGPILPIVPVWMMSKSARSILVSANSWRSLAAKLGIEESRLAATIERFNANAREGVDPEFDRGKNVYEQLYGDERVGKNPNLAPLEKPPFYGMAIYPGDIGTNGGLSTDVNASVLDTNGQPIRGLYAIGNVAACPFGRSYPGGGVTLGSAMTFGYLAARHALGAT